MTHQGPAGKRLIAYVLGAAADVRHRLSRTLPPYLVPAVVIRLERFPLTPSGKADRRELADRPVVIEGAGGAARDPVEHSLLRLWSETLDVTGVGINDNFFDTGGDSIIALTLVTELTEQFGDEITFDALYQHPTVAQMAAWIRNRHD